MIYMKKQNYGEYYMIHTPRLVQDIANLIDDYDIESSTEKAKKILDHIQKVSYEERIVYDSRFDG